MMKCARWTCQRRDAILEWDSIIKMRWVFGCASQRAPICRFNWSPKIHTVLLFTYPWYSLHSDLRIVFSVWVARHRQRTDLRHGSVWRVESPLNGERNGLVTGRKCSIAASVVVEKFNNEQKNFLTFRRYCSCFGCHGLQQQLIFTGCAIAHSIGTKNYSSWVD